MPVPKSKKPSSTYYFLHLIYVHNIKSSHSPNIQLPKKEKLILIFFFFRDAKALAEKVKQKESKTKDGK